MIFTGPSRKNKDGGRMGRAAENWLQKDFYIWRGASTWSSRCLSPQPWLLLKLRLPPPTRSLFLPAKGTLYLAAAGGSGGREAGSCGDGLLRFFSRGTQRTLWQRPHKLLSTRASCKGKGIDSRGFRHPRIARYPSPLTCHSI